MALFYPPPLVQPPPPPRGDGWGVWHKALVVGSASLWRRLLASRARTFCYAKQASALLRASALPRASTFLGGESRMQLLPIASSPDGLISARYAVITKTPGPGGAHHNRQRSGRGGGGGHHSRPTNSSIPRLELFFGAFGACDFLLISYGSWAK